jgi:hypothetical protein
MTGAQIASTPKLKKSVFSFVKPSETRATLKAESTQLEALVETNRILVEIQKQLSLDFANRIVEKRQELRGYKQRVSRERASKKEQAIESIGKFGSNIVKAFDKVAAPAKGIFQRILDFFSIIVTGLVVNNAFNWLSKKENREKLAKFFGFLANHWKELLVVFGTYKLLRLVLKIKKILDLFKRRPPRPPGGGGRGGGGGQPGGGGPGGGCGPVFSCISKIGGSAAELLAQQLQKTRVFRPLFAPPVTQKPRLVPKDIYGNLPPGVRENMERGGKTQTPGIDIVTFIIAPLVAGLISSGALAGASISSVLAGLSRFGVRSPKIIPKPVSGSSVTQPSFQGLGRSFSSQQKLNEIISNNFGNYGIRTQGDLIRRLGNLADDPKIMGDNLLQPGNAKYIDFLRKLIDKSSQRQLTIPGASQGGTVGGRGPGTVDSVPAMLAPGEEVIRTSAANLFRPLLKDINNNAGRMWLSFSTAVKQLVSSNETMRYSLNELNNNLQLFKQQLDQFVNKEKDKKLRGSGGGTFKPSELSPGQAVTNIVMPRSVSRSDLKATRKPPTKMIVPINLPEETIVGNMPAIDGGVATEEPYRDSINMSNPWRKISTEMYGIFV